ncbi:Esterase EstB (plasmid) [Variovorax sp. SRS16]|uniref:serine hydrolase domain-containing protein n=1 Tax=Variovorax sp. SRS16 TaxID=282217 RepID=UPI001315B493|nr:serine hydrolase domain-containing protein [Variovorax sp. SRS16]VTU46343.1 Esterase EstB [Variovorax sp. SRS16]
MNTLPPSGMDADRLGLLCAAIEADVERDLYHGAVIRVGRGGQLVQESAIGTVGGPGTQGLTIDSVFSIFSLTKAFTNVLALRAIELGRLSFTSRVSDVIPEFRGAPREAATLLHLLTHTAGMPGVWTPKPDMYEDRLDELLQAVIDNVPGVATPGSRCDYAPVVNHVLMGEMLRRSDPKGRAFRDIAREDLFEPLGMRDTSFGVRPDLKPRKVVPDVRGVIPIPVRGRDDPGRHGLFEQESNEAPHVGACSTVSDLWRFTEMLRQGGALDGVRILSPRMLQLARRNWTGDMPNELYQAVALRAGWTPPPAYIGLGFSVRGEAIVHHQFGTLTSPETFGNYGAGSSMFWVDPALDLSFVCCTTGLLPQAPNIERFQRLSDMVVGAAR